MVSERYRWTTVSLRNASTTPPTAHHIGSVVRGEQLLEPALRRDAVVIGERNDGSRRRLDPGVARGSEPAVLGVTDEAYVVYERYRRGLVVGTVVDDDHLDAVTDRLARERVETGRELLGPPVCADHQR